MRTVVEKITPDRAQQILNGNTDNRTIRQSKVIEYSESMKNGKWETTHQGIAIANDGRLLDGQHRLLAIIAAGVTVELQVSYDMDPKTRPAMDGGVKRSIADRLPLITDKASNKIVVALVTAYLRCTKGHYPTVEQVDDEFLDKTDAYVAITDLLRQAGTRNGISLASVGAAIAVYVHTSKDRGMEFAQRYLSGVGLNVGDPVHTLREAVINKRMSSEYEQFWKTAAACTADKQGRQLAQLVAASKDLFGNTYKRMAAARKGVGLKGAATKRAKKAEARQ